MTEVLSDQELFERLVHIELPETEPVREVIRPERYSGMAEFLLYPDESELAQTIQSYAQHIAGDEPVVTQVVHSDEPIGFTNGKVIVLSDGLIKLFDTQEEVYAVLAHEITHDHQDYHRESPDDEESTVASVGKERAHEIRADYGPYERLDELGINVAGIPMAFRKLAATRGESVRTFGKLRIEDYGHGTLMDRAINGEELLRVLDVQNARMDSSPLGLSKDAFNEYVNDDTLAAEARGSDNPHLIRYVVERQCRMEVPSSAYLTLQERLQLHDKALQLADPDLSDEEARNYSLLAIATVYRKVVSSKQSADRERPEGYGTHLVDVAVKDWMEQSQTYEDIVVTLGSGPKRAFETLGIHPDPLAYGLVLSTMTKEVLAKQETISIPEVQQVLEKVDVLLPYQHIDVTDIVLRELGRRKMLHARVEGLVEFVGDGYSNLNFEAISGEHLSRAQIDRLDELEQAVNRWRIQKVGSFQDPLELEAYLHKRKETGEWATSGWLQKPVIGAREGVDPETVDFASLLAEAEEGARRRYHPAIEKAYCSMLESLSPEDFRQYIAGALQRGAADMAAAGRLTGLYFGIEKDIIGNSLIVDEPSLHQLSEQASLDGQLKLLAYIDDPELIIGMLERGASGLSIDLNELSRIVNRISAERAKQIEAGYRVKEFDASHLRGTQLLQLAIDNTELRTDSYQDAKRLARIMSKLPLSASYEHSSVEQYEEGGEDEEDDEEDSEAIIEHELITSFSGEAYNRLMSVTLAVPEEDRDNQWYFTVAMLSILSPEVKVRLEVTDTLLIKLCERLTFDEAFEVLDEKTKFLESMSKRRAWEYLIEEKANTIEQLEKLSKVLRKNVEAFLDNSELVGALALFDNMAVPTYIDARGRREGLRRSLPEHDNFEALRLMLLSGEDDSALAEYAFGRWLYRYTFAAISSITSVDEAFDFAAYRHLQHPERARQLKHWIESLPHPGTYVPFEAMLDEAFMTGTMTKYYLLRKVLVGREGVLLDDESLQQLVELLQTAVLEDDGGSGVTMFREIADGLVATAAPDQLYHLVAPVLTDLALRFPSKRKRLTELAAAEAEQLLRQYKIVDDDTDTLRRHINLLGSKIYYLMLGYRPGTVEADKTSKPLTPDQQLLQFFGGERAESSGRMTPAQFARTVGMQSGALGVRMLQLAGQYFDLPPADAAVFEDAYDNVRGQTRVQALRVLKREARLHPETAELLDNIEYFGRRIGGGSLMTVYDVRLNDGRRVALSVKNPNVEYNLDKMTAILERSIKYVQTTQLDSPVYPALEAILGQVKQWIRDELEDPEFELKDARFKLQNDDSLHGGSEAVSLFVPSTIPTGTRRIRCEEYIEGTNLNGLAVANETDISNGRISGADLRMIVSRLAKNYVPQLLVHGLVHPDIHPGNFRVMNDARTIAVFDRYNLLELDDHEKTVIGSIAGQLVAGDVGAAADELLAYLSDLPENAGKEQAFARLRQEFGSVSAEGVGGLMAMLVKLQQASVTVPLKLALIARNFGSLNKLAVKAGFSGVAEALAT